jgi:hypothetical protein
MPTRPKTGLLLFFSGGASDTTRPTVAITCAQTSPTGTAVLNFTFTLSEASTDFVIGDIDVSNGTADNFAGSGTSYTCDVTATASGVVTVTVPENAFHDAAGNGNTASDPFEITYQSLLNGLVSYWKLDEASTGVAPVARVDSHGDNDLTDNNTVTSRAGKISNAAEFTPANSEFLSHVSNADLLTGDISFTFSLWVYFDANGDYVVIGKDAAGARDYVIDKSSGLLRFYMNGGGDTTTPGNEADSQNGGAPISANQWYYVIAWHDAAADTINIQVNNGTAVSTGTGGAFPATAAADFCIGARTYVGNQAYMDGAIDGVGFWKRTLTADEKTALYNSGDGLTYPFQ